MLRSVSRGGSSSTHARCCYTTYAFVGLGRMGSHMATNLRAKIPAADELLLYDTIPASLTPFASSQNTRCVKTLRELKDARVIITMVPAGKHVEQIYDSEAGIFADGHGTARERLLIDCSTIDPLTAIKLSERCKSLGWGTFIDAPVSGGTKGAEAGTLSFMVGAKKDHFNSTAPDSTAATTTTSSSSSLLSSGSQSQLLDTVLRHMGQTIHYCGQVGSGLSAKLCNNYLLALNNLATCEAMQMGQRLGLEGTVLGKVINSSTGKCWPSEKNNPVRGVTPGAPAERDFAGGFGIELMIKDLRLAIDAAKTAGIELPSSAAALQVYETVQSAHAGAYSGRDFGVVYKYLEDKSR